MEEIKRCKGCGAVLQNSDPSLPGYVIDLKYDYCQRCFRLTHYNDLKIDLKKAISRQSVFEAIKGYDCYGLVIDIFSFEFTLKRDLISFLKGKDLIVIVTKLDLLPDNANTAKIEEYILDTLKQRLSGSNILDILLTYKNDEIIIENFRYDIETFDIKEIVFMGNSNAGKSTLLNRLFKDNALTVSRFPSTTVDLIKIEQDGVTYIDSPGLTDDNSILMYLSKEEIDSITMRSTIKPKIFQIYQPQAFVFYGIMHISVYPKDNCTITMYFNNYLDIHRTKVSNLDEYLINHQGEFTYDPGKPLKIVTYEDLTNEDIVIDSLGFINLKNVEMLEVNIFDKIELIRRKGML